MEHFLKYRGQWGGKIESGEEMWWSEPNQRLWRSARARLLFSLDVRQHFILRFWKRAFPGNARRRAIDYGCGSGGVTLNFSRVIGQPIHGVDIFETQLSIAREFSRKLGTECEFRALDPGNRIPFGNASLDAVLSLDVLGHVPDVPETLREFARVLRPGGSVLLFTESTYSDADHSIMARLARRGADMMTVVPEHISLHSREVLERMFAECGFRVEERFSANVWHFFFFPKDYMLLLKGKPGFGGWYRLARVWNRISKVTPFYPWPFQFLRLGVTYLFGREAMGTSYFYHLTRIEQP